MATPSALRIRPRRTSPWQAAKRRPQGIQSRLHRANELYAELYATDLFCLYAVCDGLKTPGLRSERIDHSVDGPSRALDRTMRYVLRRNRGALRHIPRGA